MKVEAIDGMISVFHLRGEPQDLRDVELICKLLQDLISVIQMRPHGDPIVVNYPDTSNAKGTVTIFQCLHESFVAYDNWPEYGYAHIIVDSCKRYSVDSILEFFRTSSPFEVSLASNSPIYYPREEKHG